MEYVIIQAASFLLSNILAVVVARGRLSSPPLFARGLLSIVFLFCALFVKHKSNIMTKCHFEMKEVLGANPEPIGPTE